MGTLDMQWIYTPSSKPGIVRYKSPKPPGRSVKRASAGASSSTRSRSIRSTSTRKSGKIIRPQTSDPTNKSSKILTKQRTATFQHSRNDDLDLDLEYTMDAIRRNLEYFATLKHQRQQMVSDVRERSDNLLKYGKDQFQYRLSKSATPQQIQYSRGGSYQDLYHEKTTGPTSKGGAINNSRSKVMNSIRIHPPRDRPYTDSQVAYIHERSRRLPGIKAMIDRSNTEYIVTKTTPIPGQTKPTAILIPTDSCPEERVLHTDLALLDMLELENLSLLNPEAVTRPVTHQTERSSASRRQSVPFITLQTGSPIPSISTPSPEPPPTIRGKLGVAKKKERPTSAGRNKKKKPKCWVDNVTVSDIVPAGKGRRMGNMHAKKGKKAIEEVVVTLDDMAEDDEPQLPDFICPSSEDKSKEAAIRHWLKETRFTEANKTLPLL